MIPERKVMDTVVRCMARLDPLVLPLRIRPHGMTTKPEVTIRTIMLSWMRRTGRERSAAGALCDLSSSSMCRILSGQQKEITGVTKRKWLDAMEADGMMDLHNDLITIRAFAPGWKHKYDY